MSIDYYWAPMLVESNGDDPSNHSLNHRTVRIQSIEKHARHWVDADILVFNTYLWWRLPIIRLLKGPGSVLGGPNQVYDEIDNVRAYKKVLKTWSKWVLTHINPAKTKMFFMGLTATHSKYDFFSRCSSKIICVSRTGSGLVLVLGGGKNQETCYKETEPVTLDGFWESGTIPQMLRILESSLNKLKAKGVNVQLINITQLTQHRKDAHPTVYRRLWRPLTEEQKNNPQRTSDCTHWCLPGVPDIWNEILLAYIFPTIKTAS
ncbi:putative PC-Esterase [Helianthus annuus]|nr:putative PC-Esterase [Helianthus annuus]